MRRSPVHRFTIAAVFALATACGGADAVGSCESYVDAALDCIEDGFGEDEFGLDTARASVENACGGLEDLSGDQAQDAVELYDCYTEQFQATTCASSEDFTTVFANLTANCQGVGGF